MQAHACGVEAPLRYGKWSPKLVPGFTTRTCTYYCPWCRCCRAGLVRAMPLDRDYQLCRRQKEPLLTRRPGSPTRQPHGDSARQDEKATDSNGATPMPMATGATGQGDHAT